MYFMSTMLNLKHDQAREILRTSKSYSLGQPFQNPSPTMALPGDDWKILDIVKFKKGTFWRHVPWAAAMKNTKTRQIKVYQWQLSIFMFRRNRFPGYRSPYSKIYVSGVVSACLRDFNMSNLMLEFWRSSGFDTGVKCILVWIWLRGLSFSCSSTAVPVRHIWVILWAPPPWGDEKCQQFLGMHCMVC